MTPLEPESSVILKYIRNAASAKESMQVADWLRENPENEQALQQIARIYYACRIRERIASRDSLQAYLKIRKRINLHTRRYRLKRIWLAAACFLGGLLISSVIFREKQEGVASMPQTITIQANAGMRTHFNLPDGTLVYLNSGTTLSYLWPYEEKERQVAVAGEAYFEVIPDPERPFVVSVRNDRMRVKVLGTKFNVQAYPEEDQVQTTLVSGSVDIEVVKEGKVIGKTLLNPSDKAVYDAVKEKMNIYSVNTDYETSWKDGRLIFKNMPLPQVLKKLSYFYNVKFDVRDEIIDSYCFTGIFQDKQLSQVLDYLKITSQIEYEIKTIRADDSRTVQQSVVVLKRKRN